MNKENKIIFRYCREEDLKAVTDLLEVNQLPFSDINLTKIHLILAFVDDSLAGCIGVEIYEEEGLLRSLVVSERYRNLSIGNKLLQNLISFCYEAGVLNLHLLTNTAEKYFGLKGFAVMNRNDAPQAIKETVEFKELCPASSVYMVKKQINQNVRVYTA